MYRVDTDDRIIRGPILTSITDTESVRSTLYSERGLIAMLGVVILALLYFMFEFIYSTNQEINKMILSLNMSTVGSRNIAFKIFIC